MHGPDEYPANLVEFIDWFPSNEACLEYLEAVRWPDGFRCPKCGSEMKVIAVIQDVAEIRRILKHLKKIGRAPPEVDYSKLPN